MAPRIHPSSFELVWHNRLIRIRSAGFALLVFFAIASIGCAKSFPDYPLRTPGELEHNVSQRGVHVGVYPMTDRSESRKYFGFTLLNEDILGVLVVVQNESAHSYFLRPEQVRLALATNMQGRDEDPSSTAGTTFALVGAALLSLPLLFLGLKMISDVKTIEHNFRAKTMRNQTVSPGETVQGFIYFDITDHPEMLQEDLQVEALLVLSSDGSVLSITVPLDQIQPD